MNRKLAPVLALVLDAALSVIVVLPAFASSPDFWTTKAPPPIPLVPKSGQATVFDGKIYTLCGSNQFEMYDPDNNNWTQKASLPQKLQDVLTVCGDKIYAMGASTLFLAYDPANDSWTAKAPMPSGLGDCQANVVDGKIYVMGGLFALSVGAETLDSNFAYDPQHDLWSELASLPVSVARCASAVVDGKIYLIGGYHTNGWQNIWQNVPPVAATNAVQIFDPTTNSWSQGTPLPSSMTNLAGCATTGLGASKRIYVVGGSSPGTELSGVDLTQIYNPQIGNWSTGAPLPNTDYGLSLVNIEDRLYALGGASGTSNLMYTPTDWQVPSTPSPSPSASPTQQPTTDYWNGGKAQMPHSCYGVAVLNETIYSIGNVGFLDTYDPTSNSWVTKSQLPLSTNFTDYHIAACQNKIYVMSNDASYPSSLNRSINKLLAYDPSTDSWETKASLPPTLYAQANVVDDKIYVISGGYGVYRLSKFATTTYFNFSSTTWVYDPANDSWSTMAPIPAPVAHYGSVVVDGKIYIIGGVFYEEVTPGIEVFSNLLQIFDPQTNQWTQGTPLPTNMSGIGVAATTGLEAPKRIYVFGGAAYGSPTGYPAVTWTQIYDLQTKTWSKGTPLPIAQINLCVASLNDKLYVWGDQPTGLEYVLADYGSTAASPTPTTTPSPSVPEFPIWIILPLSLATVIVGFINFRRTKFEE